MILALDLSSLLVDLYIIILFFFFNLKSQISTSKNLGDIAMDLTEIGASRVSKMVSGDSKDKLIMASNGSLASASNKSNKTLRVLLYSNDLN